MRETLRNTRKEKGMTQQQVAEFILKTIGIQIGDDLIAISQYKPNLIEKIY